MKRYQITLDSQTFDVRLLSDPRQEQVQVKVNGQPFTVEVKDVTAEVESSETAPAPAPSPAPAAKTAAPPVGMVTAPLPGTVKSVKVRTRQQVSAGDELLVIEAMKMDNLIRASREGVIETIYVTEGHQVSHGENLLEYED